MLKIVNVKKNVVTVIEFIGDQGMCKAKVFPSSVFRDLELKWQSFTLRGYGQVADVPDMTYIDMDGAKIYWNYSIPENGSFHLCKTREERDSYLLKN